MQVCAFSKARGIDKLVYLMILLFESTGDRTKCFMDTRQV